ncbi:CynX/NimT family MFS transporter [Mucilaginibacter sp. E4BP6]|uniref:MFS transporter n=1 Tax=Mucilaginibacter sp. E4BP6 TaxID=2723089 RepID=UPI0017C25C12|nr:MFS transporter [Mucilaginibacter sp. E4BP6]NYE67031.1 CP family cyanate transporter-like MFS transporter [Mucilaginibacter sp. E4BP6]
METLKENIKTSNGLEIAGIILVALALRPSLVSMGPSIPAIQHYFGLSHFTTGSLISIPDLLMGLLALPTPWLANKLGRDKLIIGALLLLAASTLARALSLTVATLLICTAGVGTGIAIAGTLLSGFVKANFSTKAALVMGIYTTSLSMGSTISALSTAPILKATDSWRFATGVWTIAGVIGLVAWMLVAAKEKKKTVDQIKKATIEIPWKNGMAWRIALFFACVNLIFYSLVAWTAPLFIEHGLSTSNAGYILGCFTFFFMLSSPVFGSLSKSLDRRLWLVTGCLISLSGLLLIAFCPGFSPFIIIGILAIGLGGTFTLAMTLPLDNTNTHHETNAWTAFILTIGYVIAAIGPIALGALRDYTGNFTSPMLALAGVSIIMLIISFTLKPVNINHPK